MEVHHHSHTSRKKWTHYFWEFLMLFLAVFCGFLAENLREHKIEHHRAKDFAKSLIKDLQNDTSVIHEHKKLAALYISMADSLLYINKFRLDGNVASQFSFYTRFMYWTTPLLWNRATFDQIKNSGGLRYFDNYQLLEKMMKYDALIKIIEAEDYNRQVRGNLMLNHINKVIPPVYHQKLSNYYLSTIDSMSRTTMENLYPAVAISLEDKRNEIQELLNMVVVQQRNLRRDIDIPWKQAEELAIELIIDLKKEYHLE